jgi:hypothetical protein
MTCACLKCRFVSEQVVHCAKELDEGNKKCQGTTLVVPN